MTTAQLSLAAETAKSLEMQGCKILGVFGTYGCDLRIQIDADSFERLFGDGEEAKRSGGVTITCLRRVVRRG